MDEKKIKKMSLNLFKIKLELEALNDEKLNGVIKNIEAIDKEFLKENGVKFSEKSKKEILDFM